MFPVHLGDILEDAKVVKMNVNTKVLMNSSLMFSIQCLELTTTTVIRIVGKLLLRDDLQYFQY